MREYAVFCLAASLLAASALPAQTTPAKTNPYHAPDTGLGYTDTPILPGLPWHVHDPNRPHPLVVTPGPLVPEPPPPDAEVLFDGHDLSRWEGKTRKGEVTAPMW
ncbi:MAG: hypothetical protein ABI142_11945, partial [Bryocella sp.]